MHTCDLCGSQTSEPLYREFSLSFCPACQLAPLTAWKATGGLYEETRESYRDDSNRNMLKVNLAWHRRLKTPIMAQFCHERFWHKLGKLFRAEIQTGDPLFDQTVFISTNTETETRSLLRNDGVQSALMVLCYRATVIIGLHHVVMQWLGYESDYEEASSLAGTALALHVEHWAEHSSSAI
ncbi:MAG: hypothetical protein RBU37_07380 [Myxococcota bacterium]|nr:hypothetical protein [Myxococcota bacterium]